jgi:hypothetical protein
VPGLANLHQIAGHAFRFDGDGGVEHQAFQSVVACAM